MGERLTSEQFANYIARQDTKDLPALAEYYHGRRNSGIKRLVLGAAATGGVMATVIATGGNEAWGYVAMGELFVAANSSMSGILRLGTGRRSEQTTRQELQRRTGSTR